MPMKRKSTMPVNFTVAELLVMLQLQGALDSAYVEDWSIDTSVEELFDAVRLIGDGEWLQPFYPDFGVPEAADAWLGAYMDGREVPTPADAISARKKADAAEKRAAKKKEDEPPEPLREYLDHISAESRKALLARIKKDKSFKAEVEGHIDMLGRLVAAMCVLPDPQFGEMDLTSEIFAAGADSDLADMTRFYLTQTEDIHGTMGEMGLPWPTTAKRVKAVEKTLAKARK